MNIQRVNNLNVRFESIMLIVSFIIQLFQNEIGKLDIIYKLLAFTIFMVLLIGAFYSKDKPIVDVSKNGQTINKSAILIISGIIITLAISGLCAYFRYKYIPEKILFEEDYSKNTNFVPPDMLSFIREHSIGGLIWIVIHFSKIVLYSLLFGIIAFKLNSLFNGNWNFNIVNIEKRFLKEILIASFIGCLILNPFGTIGWFLNESYTKIGTPIPLKEIMVETRIYRDILAFAGWGFVVIAFYWRFLNCKLFEEITKELDRKKIENNLFKTIVVFSVLLIFMGLLGNAQELEYLKTVMYYYIPISGILSFLVFLGILQGYRIFFKK